LGTVFVVDIDKDDEKRTNQWTEKKIA